MYVFYMLIYGNVLITSSLFNSIAYVKTYFVFVFNYVLKHKTQY